MTTIDRISACPAEIQKDICERFQNDVQTSLEKLSNRQNSNHITQNTLSCEQSLDDLLNLSYTSHYWRNTVKPFWKKINDFILNQYLKPAPWQKAKQREVPETQRVTRVTRQTRNQGPALHTTDIEKQEDRSDQLMLIAYVDSICKLPTRYRSWAIGKSMRAKPYKLFARFWDTRYPQAGRDSEVKEWAWSKIPLAKDVLYPFMAPNRTDSPPKFLAPNSFLSVDWIADDVLRRSFDQILLELWDNETWSVLILLKALHVDGVKLSYAARNAIFVSGPTPPEPKQTGQKQAGPKPKKAAGKQGGTRKGTRKGKGRGRRT
ncbi:uncharacterized protein KY384_000852 [Bacidia gigantensis]|uniref:uncharacterized protein n=1 Tax=Bacidia gigantensis TaxID=2732470 RepID=UPI001D0492BE|nr:uncharacterized protein KY384_000852 [Bacidia gigantensis]KAG8534010.1 hypothetical protein KY384_000852 [Bacidia gigantensis]